MPRYPAASCGYWRPIAGRSRIFAVKRAAADVLQISPLLGPLHRVLAVYESQPFQAPRLAVLMSAVRSNGLAPSRAIAKLERNLEWLESSDNWFVKLVNRFVFWTPLCMLAVEAWRRHHGMRVHAWLGSIGDFEALSSLASFAYERPACSFPTLHEDPPAFDAIDLTRSSRPEPVSGL